MSEMETPRRVTRRLAKERLEGTDSALKENLVPENQHKIGTPAAVPSNAISKQRKGKPVTNLRAKGKMQMSAESPPVDALFQMVNTTYMCSECKTKTTERVQQPHLEEDGFDILVHYPEPLDPTPIRTSVVELLALVPPIPDERQQMLDATSILASTDGVNYDKSNSTPKPQSKNVENVESSGHHKICTSATGDEAGGNDAPETPDFVVDKATRRNSLPTATQSLHLHESGSDDDDEHSDQGALPTFSNVDDSGHNIQGDFAEPLALPKTVKSKIVVPNRSPTSKVLEGTKTFDGHAGPTMEQDTLSNAKVIIPQHSTTKPIQKAVVPLKGLPLSTGTHLRFLEDGNAEESPREKTHLRGIPPSEGTHVRFA
eukprot:jgi/Botrbrau1/21444/Bobra.0216s0052.1